MMASTKSMATKEYKGKGPKPFKPIPETILPKAGKTLSPIEKVPAELRTGKRREVDMGEAYKLTLEKHAESLRYKIAYSAGKLADELAHATTTKNKKDKEYIKGLVWSLGTLYDKLANVQGDAAAIRIPAKLLENVRIAINIQMERSASNLRSEGPLPSGAEPTHNAVHQTTSEVIRTDEYVDVSSRRHQDSTLVSTREAVVVEEPPSVDDLAKTT